MISGNILNSWFCPVRKLPGTHDLVDIIQSGSHHRYTTKEVVQ